MDGYALFFIGCGLLRLARIRAVPGAGAAGCRTRTQLPRVTGGVDRRVPLPGRTRPRADSATAW